MDQKEEWRTIPGYEGLYEASNLGRIKGLKRNTLLTQWVHHGYCNVKLCNRNEKRTCLVHRVIWSAFSGDRDFINPLLSRKEKIINHKDGNKTNNALINLESCSMKANVCHAYKNNLMSTVRPVLRIEDGVFFKSMQQAANSVGCTKESIWSACNGKREKIKGYHWQYAKEKIC